MATTGLTQIELTIVYKLPFHCESQKEIHGYSDRVVRHEVSCSAKKWSKGPVPENIIINDDFFFFNQEDCFNRKS